MEAGSDVPGTAQVQRAPQAADEDQQGTDKDTSPSGERTSDASRKEQMDRLLAEAQQLYDSQKVMMAARLLQDADADMVAMWASNASAQKIICEAERVTRLRRLVGQCRALSLRSTLQ